MTCTGEGVGESRDGPGDSAVRVHAEGSPGPPERLARRKGLSTIVYCRIFVPLFLYCFNNWVYRLSIAVLPQAAIVAGVVNNLYVNITFTGEISGRTSILWPGTGLKGSGGNSSLQIVFSLFKCSFSSPEKKSPNSIIFLNAVSYSTYVT